MIQIGTLQFEPALEHSEAVAPVVFEMLKASTSASAVGVSPIDPAFSDTAQFCEAYDVTTEESANCVVLKTKKGEERGFAALVLLASTRADINGKACEALGVKKASFASMGEAVALSHMEFGAITPIGLPNEWTILLDKRVADSTHVIIGSGIRGSKLAVSGAFLARLPNVRVVDGLAVPRA